MIKKLELILLFYFVCVVLVSQKSAYGLAGSLENLQNQVSNETGYQTELKDYISSHNITFGVKEGKRLTPDDFSVPELEDLVKSHMQFCQTTNASERANSVATKGYEGWMIALDNKLASDGNC